MQVRLLNALSVLHVLQPFIIAPQFHICKHAFNLKLKLLKGKSEIQEKGRMVKAPPFISRTYISQYYNIIVGPMMTISVRSYKIQDL